MNSNTFKQRVASIVAFAEGGNTFRERIELFVEQAKALAAGGLSVAEASQLFVALVALAVSTANELANSGPDKKAFVLEAVGYLYDTIAPQIPLPMFLSPFRLFLRPIVRGLVLSIADGLVEAIYARLKLVPAS